MRAALPPIFGRFSRTKFSVLVGQMDAVGLDFDGEKSAAKGAEAPLIRVIYARFTEIAVSPAKTTTDADACSHIGDDLRGGRDVFEVAVEDA